MNPLQTVRIALKALVRNKMRSFLTVLGVIIGVSAVIAMVAIGEGAKAQVEAAFASMGTDLLIVMPGAARQSGVSAGSGTGATLTFADWKAIQSELSAVRAAAPQLRTNTTVQGDGANWTSQVYGTTPEYFEVRSWAVDVGRPLQQSDVDGATRVAVLGRTVARELFGDAERAVGQSVRIRGVPFDVVGVAAAKGQSSTGQDFDDCVFLPLRTFQTKIHGGPTQNINGTLFVAATSTADVPRAQSQIASLLRERHKLGDTTPDDFRIRNLAEMQSAQQGSTETLSMLLAAIAAVSLLVGGIGIMNIMLVSVTERTREIGVRMALGARPIDILLQFLVESLVLAVIGGALGVAGGVGVAELLTRSFGWPIAIRVDVIVIAVLFSAAVGVGFGLYPARRAAALDPINALRYE
jgi:putative ABC transport system permease protein